MRQAPFGIALREKKLRKDGEVEMRGEGSWGIGTEAVKMKEDRGKERWRESGYRSLVR